MRDLWYPGLSVASVPVATTGGNHQGYRSKPSLPTLVKHRTRDSASSSVGREWQNASALKTHPNVSVDNKLLILHKRPASVTAKEAAPPEEAVPLTSLPEVSVGLPQEGARPRGCASRHARTCASDSCPTTGVEESRAGVCTKGNGEVKDVDLIHMHTSGGSCCVSGGESNCIDSNGSVPVCSDDDSGVVLMSQPLQNSNNGYGEPDSVVGAQKLTKGSQLQDAKPAIKKLLSIANSNTTGRNKVVPLASFCGWLPYEPTLQRDVIFATKKEDIAPRRGLKSSIRQKRSSMPAFRHFSTANEYLVEYLEQHSFTYSTIRAHRPPPKPCCVRYAEHCSEGCKLPDSHDADHDVCTALSVTSPLKTRGKTWNCLAKPMAPSTSPAGSDLLDCTCTLRDIDAGAREEESEKNHCIDEVTAEKRGQRPCGPPAVSGKPPLSVITEELGHTSSNISVNKYLVVHSKKDRVSVRLPKDIVDPDLEEDELGCPSSQAVDPCDSFIQVCDSGPSLTSDSHASLVKGRNMQNVYKFPQFQPVFMPERPKQREESQTHSSKQAIISKARSLGLVSHYVRHEKRLRDLLDQCVWQERSKSCRYGRRTASREKSKRNSDGMREPKMTPSQRGLSAAVKIYTSQMGANQATPSRDKSCLLHTKQHSSKREQSAAKCDHRSTSSTLRLSGTSHTAATCTTSSPAPPSMINKVSATSIFLRKRSAISGRTRALPVVPEVPPPTAQSRRGRGGMSIGLR